MTIAILSASVRTGRRSHNVALFFQNHIRERGLAETDLIDLAAYGFPIFEERLQHQPNPTPEMLDFARRIEQAHGVLIVTPEYNGGYPAALKNAIDLLYPQWKRKPVAISTVSDGAFGGTQVLTSLSFTMFKIGVLLVPAMFPVPKVGDNYGEGGALLLDKEGIEKRADRFLGELLWCMEAAGKMAEKKA